MTKLIEYFVEGHTGKGYVNYLQSNLQDINRIILLQDTDAWLITEVLKALIKRFDQEEIEVIRSLDSKEIIEGIILPNKSLALLNERLYHGHQADKSIIKVPLQQKIKQDKYPQRYSSKSFTDAYNSFKRGLEIHEQLEKIYIAEMDFTKADIIISKLLKKIFSNVKKQANKAIVYERLFGTNTPEGIVNTLGSLLEPIERKIFILGRAGTGKSYLMNKVLDRCRDYGIDVEVYRCSLDPHSIDMLIIPSLNICLHDNTAPHVVPIKYENVQIIDMYKETVNQRAEKNNEEQIISLKEEYKQAMQLGLTYLKDTKNSANRINKLNAQEKIRLAVNDIVKITQY